MAGGRRQQRRRRRALRRRKQSRQVPRRQGKGAGSAGRPEPRQGGPAGRGRLGPEEPGPRQLPQPLRPELPQGRLFQPVPHPQAGRGRPQQEEGRPRDRQAQGRPHQQAQARQPRPDVKERPAGAGLPGGRRQKAAPEPAVPGPQGDAQAVPGPEGPHGRREKVLAGPLGEDPRRPEGNPAAGLRRRGRLHPELVAQQGRQSRRRPARAPGHEQPDLHPVGAAPKLEAGRQGQRLQQGQQPPGRPRRRNLRVPEAENLPHA